MSIQIMVHEPSMYTNLIEQFFSFKLQGLAFTLEERQILGIHGLQPARFKSQEEQLEICKLSIGRYQEDLNKYLYLTDLQVNLILLNVTPILTLSISFSFSSIL